MEFTIEINDAATTELKNLMQTQNMSNAALRIWVAGGGCSGLSYGMALDENEPEDNDIVVSVNDIKVFVDELSAKYLTGSIVECSDDMFNGGFKITNPNAVKSCGCGSSFSTEDGGIGELNSGRGCGGCGSS